MFPHGHSGRFLGNLSLRRAWDRARTLPGLGRILHRAAEKALPPDRETWIRVQGGPLRGRLFFCNPRFHLAYIRGDHEPWTADWLDVLLAPGSTFVEVGAHLGYFTLVGAHLVGETGRVIALEPDPRNARVLRENVAKGDMSMAVTLIEAVAGAVDGTAEFITGHDYVSRLPGSDERLRLADDVGQVVQVRLDSLQLGNAPLVVKVDVEGAEAQVLQGASQLLSSDADWIVEAHSPALEASVVLAFEEAGYEVAACQPIHPTYRDYRQRYVLASRNPGVVKPLSSWVAQPEHKRWSLR
jgi:FkbM family methyltransferase